METKDLYVGGRKRKITQAIGEKNLDKLSMLLKSLVVTRKRAYNLEFVNKVAALNEYEEDCYIQGAKGVMDASGDKKNFSSRLHDLQKIVDGAYKDFELPKLSSKERLLVTVLKEVMDRNESVLIYTEYKEVIDRLNRVLKASQKVLNYSEVMYITGSVKLKERVRIEREMQPRSIVILTKAGTASINLQKANNIICYDLPWSTGTFIQLVGRVCRTDTKYDKQRVYMLEMLDTIDTYRRKCVEGKIDLIESVFGTVPTLPFKQDDYQLDKKKLKRYLLWNRKKKS